MLSQEFPLPEVLTIWDALLTDDSRYVCKCNSKALKPFSLSFSTLDLDPQKYADSRIYYCFSEKICITPPSFLYLYGYYCESDMQLSKLHLQLFRGVDM